MTDVYQEQGYESREDYLFCVAEYYGLDLEQVVRPLADILGPDEDFDALVSALEDHCNGC
jgi:hypothetical protein